LVKAIDRNRTIGEIIEKAADQNSTRLFFERFWWYDQVVFDTSANTVNNA